MKTRWIILPLAFMAHFGCSCGYLIYYSSVANAQPFMGSRNVTPLRMTDVSPDAAFGSLENGFADPGGRIVSLVVDPTNPLVLYAASEMAGIWKTADGAHHWKQASVGLRTGMSQNSFSLAVDGTNPQHILYATQDDDGRPDAPFGGLWTSDDGAATWQHVSLPNCPSPSISSVVFASGRAFAATSCGVAVTAEEATLTNATWKFLAQLPFNSGGAILATSIGSRTLFACNGLKVFRSKDLGSAGSWSAGVSLIGGCDGLAVTPDNPTKVVAVHDTSVTSLIGVSLVDIDADTGNQILSVGVQLPGNPACQGSFGSGAKNVFAARRPRIPAGFGPGRSYDVFVSDGCLFFEFQLVSQTIGRWVPISGTHVDTSSMAIPSTYDPDDGPCAAYIASDGGVFALPFPSKPAPDGCDPAKGWIRAMSRLHVMYSDTMAGVSQPPPKCPDPNRPCPALYLPTGDNDVWVSTQGGIPGSGWQLLGDAIGDAAIALADPALSNVVLVARNANYRILTSSDGGPPGVGASIVDITPANASTGGAPPGIANLAQVMTMPTEAPGNFGDYLAVASPGSSSDDIILRNTSGENSGWFDVSPGEHFGPGQVGAIATSNGHTDTIICVLTSSGADFSRPPVLFRPGKVYKGTVGNALTGIRWQLMSKGISKAYNLYADPYDPRYLYVSDLGDGTVAPAIKSSSDGGLTWQVEKDLTDIATNNGEFRLDCGEPARAGGGVRSNVGSIFAFACGLQQMIFDRSQPEIRVAALWPGGVAFSRDSGKHWLPLDVTSNSYLSADLYELPSSLFYDSQPNPTTGAPSLYVALNGKSLKRVDGPFPSLGSSLVEICPTCLGRKISPDSKVVLVVDATGTRLPLRRDYDESYRGRFLLDLAPLSLLTYHFEVDGVSEGSVSHALSEAERSAGIVELKAGPY